MSYGTVADADAALGYLPAWTALTEDEKQRRLDTAALWLDASYDLSTVLMAEYGAELVGIPARVIEAEQVAARYGLTVPLFPQPGSESKGAITKERRKVDVIETEYQYAAPVDTTRSGLLVILEVDELLRGIAVRIGLRPLVPAVFVV